MQYHFSSLRAFAVGIFLRHVQAEHPGNLLRLLSGSLIDCLPGWAHGYSHILDSL
jgi:hypothetical protein